MDYEAGRFVTFEHASGPAEAVARFAEAYLQRVLDLSSSESMLSIRRD